MWIFILIVIILIISYIYITYNSLNFLDKKSNREFLNLDNFFKKRINLIPTLVNIFSRYNLEKDTLQRMTFLIKDDYNMLSSKERIEMNVELNNLIDRLWEVADANIILKQNPVFLNAIKQFNLVEEEIITSKKYYNEATLKYNKKVRRFPSNIIALILKFKLKPIYDVIEENRKVIKTDLEIKNPIKFEDKKEEDVII